jgi:hypothetical protein
MPLDRELLKRQYEGQLDGLLAQRKNRVSDMLTRTQSALAAGRQRALGATSPVLSAYGISPTGAPSAIGLASSRLGGLLQKRAAGIAHDDRLKTIGMGIDNATRRAEEASANRMSAEGFGRDMLNQRSQQAFAAGEAEKDRGAAMTKQGIAERYQDLGLDLEARAGDDAPNMYQQAMLRSLFGLVGVGTGYALAPYTNNLLYGGRGTQAQTPPTVSAPGSTDLPYGPSVNWGYNPRQPSGGYR